MQDPRYNLHILNLFTGEKINLPPVESQLGMTKMERTLDDGFHIINDSYISETTKDIRIRSPVFWIDEKTKDYVVLWGVFKLCVVYAKKGDNLWNQIPSISEYVHMVYKDHKLYFLGYDGDVYGNFKIFHFSGEIPRETFCRNVFLPRFRIGYPLRGLVRSCSGWATKLVVTITGYVLKVVRMTRHTSRTKSFHIFKIYSSDLLKIHEKVDSLGDEAMLFDLGVTAPANEIDGLNRNSIYFKGSLGKINTNDIFIFNLETQKMEPLNKFDSSSVQLSIARWFLPSFIKHK